MSDLVDPNRHEYTYPEERRGKPEHGIVVVFDVSADTGPQAAAHLVRELVEARHLLSGVVVGPNGEQVESWWLAEGEHKEFDNNDNDDMTLVARGRLELLIAFYDQGDARGLESMIDKLREQVYRPAFDRE